MIQRCREDFPVSMMCRALKVSSSGYYEWRSRPPSTRSQDNARLLRKVRRLHDKSDCVFGSPRIWDDLRYDGETCSLNRVARLMKSNALIGIPAKKQWCKRKSGNRPEDVANHLKRDFSATTPNIKWVTEIT
jgi:putative transposase